MKPRFADDTVTLYAGDCLDALPTLPDASVDVVVTDPPYALPGGFMGKTWDTFDGREDASFAYWFAGLVDGEGCFTIKRHTRGTHAPMFALKMRRDERGTLDNIRRTLGMGTVRELPGSGGSQPQATFTVQDKAGCQRLVDLFDKYPLRAKKRLDYQIWRESVCEWTDRPRGNRWNGAADNTRMAELKTRLEGVRRYVEPPWSGHEYQDWCRLWAKECFRVLKPGGHLLAFGGTRTYHRLVCAIEDANFEIRDSMHWVYGSGFPKSLDVSKAIDKAAGAEREVLGPRMRLGDKKPCAHNREDYDGSIFGERGGARIITAPTTDDARRWQGWGTALKPAHEPIVLARKPLGGTVAGNVLTHGTGALNIDACRVGMREARPLNRIASIGYGGSEAQGAVMDGGTGRWPTNVVLTHQPLVDDTGNIIGDACEHGCVPGCPIADMDAQSGIRPSGGSPGGVTSNTGMRGNTFTRVRPELEKDTGGASRFFPVFRYEAKAPSSERPRGEDGTAHATVKPLALMRWLVRLATQPGGVVLDPFLGSGTTAEACVIEGFRCIGIERDESHLPLIKARLSKPIQPALGFEDAS